jgi:hypothetical protein
MPKGIVKVIVEGSGVILMGTLVESIREEMHELNALCKLTEEHLKEDPG